MPNMRVAPETVQALVAYAEQPSLFLRLNYNSRGVQILTPEPTVPGWECFFAYFGASNYTLRAITDFLHGEDGFLLRLTKKNTDEATRAQINRAVSILAEKVERHNSRGLRQFFVALQVTPLLLTAFDRLRDAIAGTEPLTLAIHKVYGKYAKHVPTELMEELIAEYDRAETREKANWKIRIQHILGQYLIIATGLRRFSPQQKEQCAAAENPVAFLAAQKLQTVSVTALLRVLTTATKKELLLALIMETQRPGAEPWPDMLHFLEKIQRWAKPDATDPDLDALVAKLFQ